MKKASLIIRILFFVALGVGAVFLVLTLIIGNNDLVLSLISLGFCLVALVLMVVNSSLDKKIKESQTPKAVESARKKQLNKARQESYKRIREEKKAKKAARSSELEKD
jgi:choline-glycine betaine transporter